VRVWLSRLDAGKGKQRASFIGALTEVVGTPDSIDATVEAACKAVGEAPEDVFVAKHDPRAHRWELLICSSRVALQAAETGAAEDGADDETTPDAGPGGAHAGPKQPKPKKKVGGKGKGVKLRAKGGPAAGTPFKLSDGDLLAVIPRSAFSGPAPAPGVGLEGVRNSIEALFDTEHDARMRAEAATSASKRAARLAQAAKDDAENAAQQELPRPAAGRAAVGLAPRGDRRAEAVLSLGKSIGLSPHFD
jgi:hypothetical protein